MHFLKYLIFLSVLFLFLIDCFSQVPVSTGRISSSAAIKYSPGESTLNRNGNEIISVISDDALESLQRTEIIISYTLVQRIITNAGNITVLSLVFRITGISGDIHYRGFDITEVIMPDRIDLSFLGGSKTDSSHYRYYEARNIQVITGDSVIYSAELGTTGFIPDTVRILQLQFFYDDEALSRFLEHIRLIDDYYASAAVLDSLAMMEGKIRLNDIPGYPVYFTHLREISCMMNLIGKKRFHEILDLENIDPAGFSGKYGKVDKYIRRASMTFAENLKEAEEINCPVKEDSLVAGFIDGIMRYIRWSMLVNERNGSIYSEFLNTYYSWSAFGDDREIVKSLLGKQYPGIDPSLLLKNLAVKLMDAYKDEAEKLISRSQHSEAYDLLRNAERLSGALHEYFNNDDDLESIMVRASGGIYASYLGIAGNALEQSKIKMAELYLEKAGKYKLIHPVSAGDDSVYRKVIHDYFRIRIGECDVMAGEDPEEALQCIKNIKNDLDSGSLAVVRNEINTWLDSLTSILHTDTAYRTQYSGVLVHDIVSSRRLIWMNRFDEARSYADSLEQLLKQEGQNDTAVLAAIRNYRKAVAERICWNSRESYELMMIRANRYLESKEYLTAAAFLDSAVIIAGIFPECSIKDQTAKDTISRYYGIFNYLKKQKEIDEMVSKGEYDQSIVWFLGNDTYYKQNNLKQYGIPETDLAGFAREKKIPSFTYAIAAYMLRNRDLFSCLGFLRILRYQDFPFTKAKPLQKELAGKLAERDFPLSPEEDPARMAKKYTEEDRWFGALGFWYAFRWNELKNR